jgi:membrane-bound lytic murein transglycosylase B
MHVRAIMAGALVVAAGASGALAFTLFAKPVLPQSGTASDAAPATWAAPAEPPVLASTPQGPGAAGLVDGQWLLAKSNSTGIPARALAAYAGVAAVKSDAMPTCGLSWNTLAAIGFVESRHGSHGGAIIRGDGTVSPGIFGVALDGGATAHIPDSDDGLIDGDTEFDRAVGPMQFIPQTWRNWHVDASGDGVEDPQNFDDAVMATANYLCRASGDMASMSGWQAGVAAYNSADSYLLKIADAGVAYAG